MNILFREQNYAIQEKIQKNTYIDNFTVVDSNFNEIQFKDIKGKKVILTVPSVDTKVCSLELGKFIHLLQDYDVTLVSISMDLPFALDRWYQNNSQQIIATSDFRYHDFKNMSGLFMKEIGLFVRSVMIVNDQNQVEYIEIVENTHTEPNYDNVLAQLKRK